MKDYISREAANEACREAVRRYPNSFYNGIEAARDAIRNLPAADVRPRWIPVTERLPEKNGRYLVRYKRDIVLDYTEVHDDEARIMRFFVGDGWRYPFLCQPELRKAEQQTVTHWMALPGLPVEENTNGK